MIDLSTELASALASAEVKEALAEVVRGVIRQELRGETLAKDDHFVDAEEAARFLGMTVGAVQKAAARGTLPCRRFGRRLRFRLSELVPLTPRR